MIAWLDVDPLHSLVPFPVAKRVAMRLLSKASSAALMIVPILALSVLACGILDDGQQTDPFRIGVMESLTGPGETYGTVANQAKQMAADEINAAGGINGRMLELVVEDSKCGAQDAIAAYNKLTDVDGVKIILGTSCSGAMLGVAPLAEADGVILFSGLASNPDIANAGDYIFRTQISDIQVGIVTGNALWADGVRDLATITETTDYAEGVRRTTVSQFEKRDGGRLLRRSGTPPMLPTSDRCWESCSPRIRMRSTWRPSPNSPRAPLSSRPGSWATKAPSTRRRSRWERPPWKSQATPRRA